MTRPPPFRSIRCLAVLVLLLMSGCRRGQTPPPADPSRQEPGTFAQPVNLYFPGENGLLMAERREIRTTGEAEDQVAAVVRLVLTGPESDSLAAPFATEVTLAAVQLSPSGVVYIDLKGKDGAGPPSGGSTEERQRWMSLVNSVALNVPEARRVVLLWNGVQPETLGGHFDASRPFAPDLAMVARQP